MSAVEASVGPGLHVRFAWQGEPKLPAAAAPRFADGLWQHTCFEVFIARKGMPGYREYNLSPAGEWAAYAFSGYREGMSRLAVRPELKLEGKTLEAIIPEGGELLVGLSAVIEEMDGTLSYWALKHAPGKPDFHHPDAFALAFRA